MQKTLLFVASSIKHSLYCVAGIDVESKRFFRIVKDESGKEIDWRNYKIVGYRSILPINNNLPFLAKVNILKKVPLNYQPENVIIDKNINFIKTVKLEELEEYVSYPRSLWGKDSYIEYSDNLKINYSLFLIKVDKIKLYLKDRSLFGKSPQRRGIFRYNNIIYDLPLTDPGFEYLKEEVLANKYLIISLGEPYEGKCYKIIAKIFKEIPIKEKILDLLGL